MWNKSKASGYLFDPAHLCSLRDWLIHCQVSPAPCRHVKRDGCDHLIRVEAKRQSLAGYPGVLWSAIINAPRLSLLMKMSTLGRNVSNSFLKYRGQSNLEKGFKKYLNQDNLLWVSINILQKTWTFMTFVLLHLSRLFTPKVHANQTITRSISTSSTSSPWKVWTVGTESRNSCRESKYGFPDFSLD